MTKRRLLQSAAGLVLGLLMALGQSWFPARGAVPGYVGYPYFYIAAVVRDTSVTILPYNFPPNDTFTVRMNYYGTYGIGGYVVDTVTTDASGTLSKTVFNVPAGLAGQVRIAIRLESPTTGYYAYNWFWNNNTAVTPTATPSATPAPTPTATPLPWPGYPYFFITAVARNATVTIKPHNFPANDTFTVRMNYYGTYGIGGYVVDTVTTDASGTLSKTTFNIPAGLANLDRIAIRLESPTTGYYAYNWFWNFDATVPAP